MSERARGRHLRVLHVLNASSGGAAVSLVELLRAAHRDDAATEHYVIYPGGDNEWAQAIERAAIDTRVAPLRTWHKQRYPSPWLHAASMLREAASSGFGLRSLRETSSAAREWDVDLVATNCSINIDGALAARRLGLPHVWHIRERIGEDGSIQFRQQMPEVCTRLGQLADAFAVVSKYAAEPLFRNGLADKVRIVHDGVDCSRFAEVQAQQGARALRGQWGVRPGELVVGKVANVTATLKRHEVFVQAAGIVARQRSNVRFVVIGALPGERPMQRDSLRYYEKLRAMAAEMGLADRLVWAGDLPEPASFMAALDIVAHACEMEAFPRVVLEAMAAGRAVVGPASGGFAEGVGDSGAGVLVEPLSAEALAASLRDLLDHGERRQAAGAAGQRRAREAFDIHAHRRVLAQTYADVLSQRRRGHEPVAAGYVRDAT